MKKKKREMSRRYVFFNTDQTDSDKKVIEADVVVLTSAPDNQSNAATKEYVDNAIAGVAPPTLSSILAANPSAGNHKITNLAHPTDGTDAASKNYVDIALVNYPIPSLFNVLQSGTSAQNLPITDLQPPNDDYDAATKKYVDDQVGAVNLNLGDVLNNGNVASTQINMDFRHTINVPSPVNPGDSANKDYVDLTIANQLTNYVSLNTPQTITANKIFTAGIDCNNVIITNVGTPANTLDAANKLYVDSKFENVDLSGSFTPTDNNTSFSQMEYLWQSRENDWVTIRGRCYHKINTVDPSQSITFDIPSMPIPAVNDWYGWLTSHGDSGTMTFGLCQVVQGSPGLIIYWSNSPTDNYWSNFSISYRV